MCEGARQSIPSHHTYFTSHEAVQESLPESEQAWTGLSKPWLEDGEVLVPEQRPYRILSSQEEPRRVP